MDGPKHAFDKNNCPRYNELIKYFKENGYNIIFENSEDTCIKLDTHVNQFVKNFINKTYKWDENGTITFSEGELHTTWGKGEYKILRDNFVEVSWMGFFHIIKFNEDFTNFISIRKSDLNISIGT